MLPIIQIKPTDTSTPVNNMFKNWMFIEQINNERIKKIDIFDFDGTLFNSPTPKKAKEIIDRHNIRMAFENKPEIKMVKHNYWNSPISLEPPVVPSPAPCVLLNQKVAREFYASKRNPEKLTIIMTGRPPELRSQLTRILNDFKLDSDRLFMMSSDRSSLDQKIEHICQLLDELPNVEEVEMWDDRGTAYSKLTGRRRDNNIGEFKKVLNIYKKKKERRNPDLKFKFKINEIPPTDNDLIEELKAKNTN